MKKYDFQYTKILETVIFVIGVCFACCLVIFLLLYLKAQVLWIYLIPPIFGIGLFRILRKYFAHNGNAEISETGVEIELSGVSYKFNFADLISHKYVFYKNGPVLYLKTKAKKMRLEANNNVCRSENFEVFCQKLVGDIELYKNGS